MGLSQARAALPKDEKRPALVIDLSALGITGTVSFIQPGVKELFTASEARQQFIADFPDLADTPSLINVVLLMAACYIPEDGETAPAWRELGLMARENRNAYLFLQSQFLSAFPQDMASEYDSAKNDLTQ